MNLQYHNKINKDYKKTQTIVQNVVKAVLLPQAVS